MNASDVSNRLTSVVTKCTEVQSIIAQAQTDQTKFEEDSKKRYDTDAKKALLIEKQVIKMLSVLDRVDGKVAFIQDVAKSLKQNVTSEEAGAEQKPSEADAK